MNVNPFETLERKQDHLELLIKGLDSKLATILNPQKRQPELLTIDQAAELLHLHKTTIYSKTSKGEIPGVCKQGKRLYFQSDVLIDWIKEGRQKSNAEIEAEASTFLVRNEKREVKL